LILQLDRKRGVFHENVQDEQRKLQKTIKDHGQQKIQMRKMRAQVRQQK